MCGIVGLHLRTPELYPRLGSLLTGMLCEMGQPRQRLDRRPPVYGDPTWSPPGRGGVSAGRPIDRPRFPVASAVTAQLGRDIDVMRRRHYLLSADVKSAVLLDAVGGVSGAR